MGGRSGGYLWDGGLPFVSYPDDDIEQQTAGTAAAQAGDPTAELDEDDDTISGQGVADDASEAPEEDNQSALPGDPRPANMQQPPFREQY